VAIVVVVVALFVGQKPRDFLAIHHPQMMKKARPAVVIGCCGIHWAKCQNRDPKIAKY
jgi:hypothetical protein